MRLRVDWAAEARRAIIGWRIAALHHEEQARAGRAYGDRDYAALQDGRAAYCRAQVDGLLDELRDRAR